MTDMEAFNKLKEAAADNSASWAYGQPVTDELKAKRRDRLDKAIINAKATGLSQKWIDKALHDGMHSGVWCGPWSKDEK